MSAEVSQITVIDTALKDMANKDTPVSDLIDSAIKTVLETEGVPAVLRFAMRRVEGYIAALAKIRDIPLECHGPDFVAMAEAKRIASEALAPD